MRRGADGGTVVEVIGDYEGAARELANAVGISGRSSFVLADLVEAPEAVDPADIVVLRRVVCCSRKARRCSAPPRAERDARSSPATRATEPPSARSHACRTRGWR